MKKLSRFVTQLLVTSAVFCAMFTIAACTDVAEAPDVAGELSNSLSLHQAPLIVLDSSAPQTIRCAGETTISYGGHHATVIVDWDAAESSAYESKQYSIMGTVNGAESSSVFNWPQRPLFELAEGTYDIGLKVIDNQGNEVPHPGASCDVTVRVDKRCRFDEECNDNNACTDDFCEDKLCSHDNNTDVFDNACYTGVAATNGVGTCKPGVEYCQDGAPTGVCEGQSLPGVEVCNEVDDDCDGLIDEGLKQHTYYRDADGDGAGNPFKKKKSCKPPKGYVAGGDDCLDEGTAKNPNGYTGVTVQAKDVNPDATEKCNDIDDNCSGGGTAGPYSAGHVDETFTDKGAACSSVDSNSCNDSVKVCQEDGTATFCPNYLAWGTYGFSGGSKILDVSGFGNHGQNGAGKDTSTLPPIKVPTISGNLNYPQSMSFWGSNKVTITHSGSKPYNISTPQITMMAWIRWTGWSYNRMLINKENSYEIGVIYGKFQCAVKPEGGSWFWAGTKSLTANKWHHVACTYSKSTCKIETWVDGVKESTTEAGGCGNVKPSTYDLLLGDRSLWSTPYAGQIAAVGVYDIKLSDSQIKALAKKDTVPFLDKQANYEYCDGLDNNCKAGTDEPYTDLGDPCSAGNGTCEMTTPKVCDWQSSIDTNQSWGVTTLCLTNGGQPGGTACNDSNSCTYSDKCTGGVSSSCSGTSYSCSGTCRSCDSVGGCNLAGGQCFLGNKCNPASSGCTGSCYDTNDDMNSSLNTNNSGSASCKYCNPGVSKNTWTNRPSSWVCHTSTCSGLTFYNTDYCNGSGTCSDKGTQNCNDASIGVSSVCTDDSCIAASGCKHVNNTFSANCYTGPPNTLDVGICHSGTETCANGNLGACLSQQKPLSESCNSKDDDCDGTVDEENASGCSNYNKDVDGDTFGVDGDTKCLCAASYPYTAKKGGDCDDSNKNAYPGNNEKCNGFDDNCNGVNNEDNAQGCTVYYKDGDNDGYGLSNDSKCKCKAADPYDTTLKDDCNDGVASIHPNAKEYCNGVDDDCQGGIDEDFNVGAACTKGAGQCSKNGKMKCTGNGLGTQCDETGLPAGTICYDGNNCTHSDVCSGGDNSACGGTPYSCNDGKSCTNDVCLYDRAKFCSYTIQSGKCLIAGGCWSSGDKNSSTGNGACQYCNTGVANNKWTNAPSSWVCRPANCGGLTFNKVDYCGNGTGACVDSGTKNCDDGNNCKNYGCTTSGCNVSNKGNGTACGGSYCAGDTWYYKDKCQDGVCKDFGTHNCNDNDTSCTNVYCKDQPLAVIFDEGCTKQHYGSGTKCGGENCSGKTYNKKDTCNGSGTCNDGGTLNCSALSGQCREGMCNAVGCYVDNYSTAYKCKSSYSNQCVGNTWYYQDYCNGTGSCSEQGSSNCDSSDTVCRDYYCSGGCQYTNKSSSTVCKSQTCANSCSKKNTTYCDGGGGCSSGGANVSCGGNRCSGSNCTSACSSNGQCCDTSGDNRTCLSSQCNNRQDCGGNCDGGDHADCKSGQTCANCSGSKCQNHNSGWHCYKAYNNHSICGCSSYDQYNNCTGYHNCWNCGGAAVDATPPDSPTFTSTVPKSPSTNASPTLKGLCEGSSQVRIYKTSNCTGSVHKQIKCSNTGSFSIGVSASTNTTNKFSATAQDAAGNTSSCSDALTYVHDTKAPAKPTLSGFIPSTPNNTSTTPWLNGTSEKGALVSIYKSTNCSGNSVAGKKVLASSGAFSVKVTVAANSKTAFTAKAKDAAGNVGPCSAVRNYLHDKTAPAFKGIKAITVISPTKATLTWDQATDANTTHANMVYQVCVTTSATWCKTNFAAWKALLGKTSLEVTFSINYHYYVVVRAQDQSINLDTNSVQKAVSFAAWAPSAGTWAEVNMRTKWTQALPGVAGVKFTLASGTKVGANKGKIGFDTGSWPTGSRMFVIMNSGVKVMGHGGNAAPPSPVYGDGGNGLAGGTAFRAQIATSITNNGVMGGGGGGGGAGAGGQTSCTGTSTCTTECQGGGGGGGAGLQYGQYAGSVPNEDSGGSGQVGSKAKCTGDWNSSHYSEVTCGSGGKGGNLGESGSTGNGAKNVNTVPGDKATCTWNGKSVGNGGAAGCYISGQGNVTWVTKGTVKGCAK